MKIKLKLKYAVTLYLIISLICLLVLSGCNAQKPDTVGSGDASNITKTIPDDSANASSDDEPIKDNPENSIIEESFTLESDGYKLNAVYTYINDGKVHPAVLLIAGSGLSDYNESVGVLKPFEDIAQGLAKEGINSLRVDKRTFRYASEFDIKSGIAEEYLDDCNAAIEYLKAQNISGLYLLGHSLGGQIVSELAATNEALTV